MLMVTVEIFGWVGGRNVDYSGFVLPLVDGGVAEALFVLGFLRICSRFFKVGEFNSALGY